MGYLRIIGGEYKGRKIRVPCGSRPLVAIFRKKIFDILSGYVENADVLDLFAGSGSFGIEALSRGAKSAAFVEKRRNALRTIRKNTEFIKNKGIRIYPVDALDFIRKSEGRYDIVFADPPFLKGFGEKLMKEMDTILNMINPS
ncbi:MAG: RsmD family RNA methyltransferase, partial [bacterium]